MRPIPSCLSHGPRQPALSQALAAAGYTLGPSPFAGKRLLSRHGAPVGHYTAGEAADAFRGDVDAALARLAAGVEAALAV